MPLHDAPQAQKKDCGIAQLQQKIRHGSQYPVDIIKRDSGLDHSGMIAGPAPQKSVFRTGGFDRLHHTDAGNGSCTQKSLVAQLNSGYFRPFFCNEVRYKQVQQYGKNAYRCQKRAVGDHDRQIEYQHDKIDQDRSKLTDQSRRNGIIRSLPFCQISR